MRTTTFLIFYLIAVAISTGCATATYHDKMKSVSSEVKEFAEFDGRYRLYKGVYSDKTVAKGGRVYYQAQFSGALDGSGRFLNVLVPVEYGYDPVIFESATEIENGRRAYLAVERYCCMDDYREIFDPSYSLSTENDAGKMRSVLKKYFPDLKESGSGVMLIHLSFTNVNYFSMITRLWRPDAENGKIAENAFLLNADYSKLDVKWSKRSRAVSVLAKGGYLFTAVADIVTSPVQLIGVIIYFAAGGAVR